MDQELQNLITSLRKQNANSVFELLKTQKQMTVLEEKMKLIEQRVQELLLEKEKRIEEANRLTIEKLTDIKRSLE